MDTIPLMMEISVCNYLDAQIHISEETAEEGTQFALVWNFIAMKSKF
jgi:hypothetical protein